MTAASLALEPTAHAVPSPTTWWPYGRKSDASTPMATPDAPDGTGADAWAEDLWTSHGQVVYSMACALLGDESAAMRAVALGMLDLVRSDAASADDTVAALTRHVYRRSTELAAVPAVSTVLPPAMAWLAQLARLQRAALALCVFGGLRYTEAAELLGVTPLTLAGLLSSGLAEVQRLSEPVIVI